MPETTDISGFTGNYTEYAYIQFPSDLNTWLSIVNMDKAAFNTFSEVNS